MDQSVPIDQSVPCLCVFWLGAGDAVECVRVAGLCDQRSRGSPRYPTEFTIWILDPSYLSFHPTIFFLPYFVLFCPLIPELSEVCKQAMSDKKRDKIRTVQNCSIQLLLICGLTYSAVTTVCCSLVVM